MQRRKKKAQVVMFVHDLIICIYLFIVITTRKTDIRCRFYYDCPRLEYHFCECIEDFCAYIRLN
ncbi:putative Late nodulin [Medicago truncatula]|uniref:Nodule-specific cysteine-rich peptide 313 n=1 Tax=Medicago truncatula TaxID=3880 RepID=A7KHE3_MEDTR|nr:nodule-specific cysteine-rich peptide 313 [Medicago truncatula]RHN60798.1 putative Late nodulin [Medicago truncatula]